MTNKIFAGLLAFAMVLALTGCGQSVPFSTNNGENTANTTTTGSTVGTTATEPTSGDSVDEKDVGTADGASFDNESPLDSSITSSLGGPYTYTVNGFEFECATNIDDYIDGDIWRCGDMMADLGYHQYGYVHASYVPEEDDTGAIISFGGRKAVGNDSYYQSLGYSADDSAQTVYLQNDSSAQYHFDYADGALTSRGQIILCAYLAEHKISSYDSDPLDGILKTFSNDYLLYE